jgi:outer membrane receptor protein involved in Fe transport
MGSLELPSYGIFDAGASYRWYMKNNNVLKFRLNVNNVLNKQYISQSDTNIHPEAGEPTWEGVNMDNRVYFGNGITWNASVSLSF